MFVLLLSIAASAQADEAAAPVELSSRQLDGDGFSCPLDQLRFNPGLDQREFERATLDILNMHDPWEPWSRRVCRFNYRFDEWVFLPVVRGYEYVTLYFVRNGANNFFGNLGDVPNLLNNLV